MNRSLSVVMVLGFATGAYADTLWDQPVNPDIPAFVDQQFADFPDFSTYLVSDVVFDTAVNIDSITTYFTNLNGGWPLGDVGAVLNIFDAPLEPGDDPTAGMAVAATMALGPVGLELTTLTDIDLAAGTYWIGLTPDLDFGVFGQEFHQGSDVIFGMNSMARNPGGGFGLGTDWFEAGPTFEGIDPWDAAITITGTATPTPGALALLGLALVAPRRRR